MERRLGVSPFNQVWKNFRHLQKATWPSVDKQQGDCLYNSTWLMDEMDLVYAVSFNLNLCDILGQSIQLLFHVPPVELMLPSMSQSFDVVEWRATSLRDLTDDFRREF